MGLASKEKRPMRWLMLGSFLSMFGCDGSTYTLYRNSILDPKMRIHVASFDTAQSSDYNHENCQLAADLFVAQPNVKTRFWCEKGPFRE